MSLQEWEGGQVKVPAKSFRQLRISFIEAVNEDRAAEFADAVRAYEGLVSIEDRTTVDREEMIEALVDLGASRRAAELMCDGESRARLKTPMKPKKKDFAPYPTSKGIEVYLEHGAYVELDNKTHTVHYMVDKADPDLEMVDKARALEPIQALFNALENVDYTARSGGCVVRGFGEDESMVNVYGGLGERGEFPS